MNRVNINFIILIFLIFISFSCNKNEVKTEDISKDKSYPEVQKTNQENSQRNIKEEIRSEKPEKYSPGFDIYQNSRYGFSFKYPADIKSKIESSNTDGCEFIYEDGFDIKVYGSNDPGVLNKSKEYFFSNELKNHKDITYKTQKNNWFVISGYDGEKIFYVKMFIGLSSRNVLYIYYPSNLRDKYYDAISVISKSFAEGDINQSH